MKNKLILLSGSERGATVFHSASRALAVLDPHPGLGRSQVLVAVVAELNASVYDVGCRAALPGNRFHL